MLKKIKFGNFPEFKKSVSKFFPKNCSFVKKLNKWDDFLHIYADNIYCNKKIFPVIHYLIESEIVDPILYKDRVNDNSYSLLSRASYYGDLGTIKLLSKNKKYVEYYKNGRINNFFAFSNSVFGKHVQTMEYLLKNQKLFDIKIDEYHYTQGFSMNDYQKILELASINECFLVLDLMLSHLKNIGNYKTAQPFGLPLKVIDELVCNEIATNSGKYLSSLKDRIMDNSLIEDNNIISELYDELKEAKRIKKINHFLWCAKKMDPPLPIPAVRTIISYAYPPPEKRRSSSKIDMHKKKRRNKPPLQ